MSEGVDGLRAHGEKPDLCDHDCGTEAAVQHADGRLLCKVCYLAEAGVGPGWRECPTCGDECGEQCAAVLRDAFAAKGVEATVSSEPPLIPSQYKRLGMRCPHGVLWHAEPTTEQIAAWAEAGVE